LPSAGSAAFVHRGARRDRSILRVELQGRRIDAVAQARRVRPVVEDVPQVPAARGAQGFGPGHEERPIRLRGDRPRAGRREEAWPAVPDSNFASERKSSVPHPAHRYVPGRCSSHRSPVKARSVPFWRRTRYCSGVRAARHSASDLVGLADADVVLGSVMVTGYAGSVSLDDKALPGATDLAHPGLGHRGLPGPRPAGRSRPLCPMFCRNREPGSGRRFQPHRDEWNTWGTRQAAIRIFGSRHIADRASWMAAVRHRRVTTLDNAGPLLETKLYAPRLRRGLVARPRLSDRLGRGAESKLTLISAPAGFGKTTLLAEWLAAAPADGQSVAWLSLDQADNQAASFWTYLIAALQTVAPAVGASALSLLQGPQATADRDGPRDAAQRAQRGAERHRAGARRLPPGRRPRRPGRDRVPAGAPPPPDPLVIATRADPALPLVAGEGAANSPRSVPPTLRFTPDEAAAYLNDRDGAGPGGAGCRRA